MATRPPTLDRRDDGLFDPSATLPEVTQPQVSSGDGFAPNPGLGEVLHAERVRMRSDRTDFELIMLRDGYAPIVDALGYGITQNPAAFNDPDPFTAARFGAMQQWSELRRGWAGRRDQEEAIAAAIRLRRRSDPDFLKGVPETVDGLRKYFLEGETARRAHAGTVLERSSGVLATGAQLLGGGIEALHDPVNIAASIVTAPIGGGGGVLATFGREALINGAIEAVLQPKVAENRELIGEELTFGEAVGNVATAAVAGGTLATGLNYAGRLARPVGEAAGAAYDRTVQAVFEAMPKSVQKRWAGKMKAGWVDLNDLFADVDNHELADFAETTIGRDKLTPDEAAALNVLRREQEVGEASPFEAGPDGDLHHEQRLGEAIRAVLDGARPRAALEGSTALTPPAMASRPFSAARASVPHDIVEFFRAKGYSDAQAYGIAAGIAAEARGGDHTAVNPSSGALGLGQWLGSRKAEIIRRYGPNPTRQQQLEFVHYELQGGDAGGKAVLAQTTPGAVLDAYIRKFMRPAAGAETTGDLERGMAALGEEGPAPASVALEGGGDDAAIAAARQAADQAEREGLELSGQLARDAAEGGSRAPELEPVPILKRDLFGSDADWFEAQVAVARSIRGESDAAISPQAAGNGPQGRETPREPPEVAQGGEKGAPAAPGEAEELSPAKYVDAYLRGEGRGDSPRDQALFQYATNNGPAIEAEFARRASAEPKTGLLTRAELEASRPADNRRDALWLAGSHVVSSEEGGRASAPIWAARDRETGEIITWSTGNRRRAEGEIYRKAAPEDVDVEKLTPEMVTAELRRRAADQAAISASAKVKIEDPALTAFDKPQGEGRKAQAESLEHDLRMDAAAEQEADPFAPELPELAGDWDATVAVLSAQERGSVPGALEHPGIGKIDVVWGEAGTGKNDGFGLAKIARFHPQVVDRLPEIVRGLPIVSRSENRIQLESADHKAAVRLDFDGQRKTWLLTAFGKEEKAPPLPDDRRGSAGGRDGSPDRGADGNISALAERGNAARYRLSEEGEERPLADILAEHDRKRAALQALKDCLKPGGGDA